MMKVLSPTDELTAAQFGWISDRVRELCGINLHQGKAPLVRARLVKRLRTLGLSSYGQYLRRIKNDPDGTEVMAMLDALSTNLTYFFREPRHFEILRSRVLPALLKRHDRDRRLRLWSAGCSSGEEPYSIAITLHEAVDDLASWNAGILATDLSSPMLHLARRGLYPPHRLRAASPRVVRECFLRFGDRAQPVYRVRNFVRRSVDFARLNLMDRWPMKGPLDVIFCRNVMIYFDKAAQAQLVERFWNLLAPGGTLFVGHSESLAGLQDRFRYVQPTVYEKP